MLIGLNCLCRERPAGLLAGKSIFHKKALHLLDEGLQSVTLIQR
jgi:hypothetical protein